MNNLKLQHRIYCITVILLAPLFALAQDIHRVRVIAGTDSAGIDNVIIHNLRTGERSRSGPKGYFSVICAEPTDSVRISKVGYRSETLVCAQIPAVWQMHRDEHALQEVVVSTGYTRISRERATGSFAFVGADDLARTVSSDVLSQLEGMAGGLQFSRVNTRGEAAKSPQLRVRGLSTIESNENPLIVLDNFVYEGDISTINPNDIESVTVLRDAAAASIWGARAGNGVIVITTKSGSTKLPIEFDVNSNTTIGDRPDLYYGKNWLPSATVMGFEKERFEFGGYTEEPTAILSPYVDLLYQRKNGRISDDDLMAAELRLKGTDTRAQALRHLYRPSIAQRYNLQMRGGTERATYYMSAGMDLSDDMVIGNGDRRYTVTFRNTLFPIAHLRAAVGLSYVNRSGSQNGITMDMLRQGAGNITPYLELVDATGMPAAVPYGLNMQYQRSATDQGLLDWFYRPIQERDEVNHRTTDNEIRLSSELEYSILGMLKIGAFYQYQHTASGGTSLYGKDSYYARNLVNRYTQANGSLVIPYGEVLSGYPGRKNTVHNGRVQLGFDRAFTDHHIAAMAGVELRQDKLDVLPGFAIYGYDSERLTGTVNLNYNQSYSTRPAGSSRLPAVPMQVQDIRDRYMSYFSNLAYTFKGRYLISGSARWDGSNLVGVKVSQRGVPLWSIGTGWEISRENFYSVSDVLPYLRLRTTYGSSGNINKTVSALPVIRYINDSSAGWPAARLWNSGNPSLRWEKVHTLNFGLDWRISDWFSGQVEYYVKDASDLIGEDAMAPSSGITNYAQHAVQYKINYADLMTKGADIQLDFRPLRGRFQWRVNNLLSFVGNRITNFNTKEVNDVFPYLGSTPPPTVGQSRDVLYALPWYGLDAATGYPTVYVDGKPSFDYTNYLNNLSPERLVVAGVSVPRFYGSMRQTFSYRGFSMDFMLSWKAGYVFRRSSMNSGQEYYGIYDTDYYSRWERPGDEAHTDVPARRPIGDDLQSTGPVYSDSEALITKGDHIRFKDVNLSYTFPDRWSERIGFKQVSLYGYMRNSWVLWRANDQGIDPEYPYAEYPEPASYSIGLRLKL